MGLNLGQREDLAKFFLDIAKLVVAVLILGGLARGGEMSVRMLGGAVAGTAVCVGIAVYMRR